MLVAPGAESPDAGEYVLLGFLPEPFEGSKAVGLRRGLKLVQAPDLLFFKEDPDFFRPEPLNPEHLKHAVRKSLPEVGVLLRFPLLEQVHNDRRNARADPLHLRQSPRRDKGPEIVRDPFDRTGGVMEGTRLERIGPLQLEKRPHFIQYGGYRFLVHGVWEGCQLQPEKEEQLDRLIPDRHCGSGVNAGEPGSPAPFERYEGLAAGYDFDPCRHDDADI